MRQEYIFISKYFSYWIHLWNILMILSNNNFFYEGGMGSISIWICNTRWRFLEHYTWHICVGEEGGKAASICVYGFMLYMIGKKNDQKESKAEAICSQNSSWNSYRNSNFVTLFWKLHNRHWWTWLMHKEEFLSC